MSSSGTPNRYNGALHVSGRIYVLLLWEGCLESPHSLVKQKNIINFTILSKAVCDCEQTQHPLL